MSACIRLEIAPAPGGAPHVYCDLVIRHPGYEPHVALVGLVHVDDARLLCEAIAAGSIEVQHVGRRGAPPPPPAANTFFPHP